MSQYESKSFEELRFEYYMSGNKGRDRAGGGGGAFFDGVQLDLSTKDKQVPNGNTANNSCSSFEETVVEICERTAEIKLQNREIKGNTISDGDSYASSSRESTMFKSHHSICHSDSDGDSYGDDCSESTVLKTHHSNNCDTDSDDETYSSFEETITSGNRHNNKSSHIISDHESNASDEESLSSISSNESQASQLSRKSIVLTHHIIDRCWERGISRYAQNTPDYTK